jgi:hypothetical protein
MLSIRKSSNAGRGCQLPLMVAMLAIGGPVLGRDPPATSSPPASAKQDAVSQPAPSQSPLAFAPGKTSSGWLPFEFVAGTRIFFAATINGRPVLAMLDSGASSTVLDRRFASSLGLTPKGDLTGEGAGGSTPYGVVKGVDLKLGDLDWKGGAAVAIDLSAVERHVGQPLPVILGGELFRHAIVDIDFQGRRIAFRDPSSYRAPASARAVTLTSSRENLVLSALVEGRPAKLLFDLGNAGALDLFPGYWRRPGFASRPTSTALVGGVGGMSVQKVAMIRTIDLGGAKFANVPTRLENEQFSRDARSGLLDGNVGMGILDRFHLIVDFPHRRVLFARPIDVSTPFRLNHVGLTTQPGPTGPTVLYVAPGSPAAIAGVTVGEVIVAINGRAEGAGQTDDAWQDGPVGQTFQLRLGDGQVKTVTLAKFY